MQVRARPVAVVAARLRRAPRGPGSSIPASAKPPPTRRISRRVKRGRAWPPGRESMDSANSLSGPGGVRRERWEGRQVREAKEFQRFLHGAEDADLFRGLLLPLAIRLEHAAQAEREIAGSHDGEAGRRAHQIHLRGNGGEFLDALLRGQVDLPY